MARGTGGAARPLIAALATRFVHATSAPASTACRPGLRGGWVAGTAPWRCGAAGAPAPRPNPTLSHRWYVHHVRCHAGGGGWAAGGQTFLDQAGGHRSFSALREGNVRSQTERGVFLISCPDQPSIVNAITALISKHGASLVSCDLHVDVDDPKGGPQLLCRTLYDFSPTAWARQRMEEEFARLGAELGARVALVHVPKVDPRLKMGILVSWQDHVLLDLLNRYHEGELEVDIACVVSNHDRAPDSHVAQMLSRHRIPFFHMPVDASEGGKAEQEAKVLEAVGDTDFLVLARYMRVLSADFLGSYKRDVINIHHGLLPSFKGANPYRQAYRAGVKAIGASSHFVTDRLDEGPLIEQMVTSVSHRDRLATFAEKSQDLERQCLATAVRYYLDRRLLRLSYNRVAVMN